jgi:plasmid stabilization system protein ParE
MIAYDFHPEVRRDLAEIWEFLADDSFAPDQVVEDIVDRINALVPFPHQGYKRPGVTSRPLRFCLQQIHVRRCGLTH